MVTAKGITGALLIALLACGPALAGEPVDVPVGGTTILRLDRPARQVIIGNPGVADVTVQTPTLITVFGRLTGGTTVTALDAAGNLVLDRPVVVIPGGDHAVAITYAAGKGIPAGGRAHIVHCGATRCTDSAALATESRTEKKDGSGGGMLPGPGSTTRSEPSQ